MKESKIRQKAIEVLKSKGYVCWYPPKVRYRKEQDVFGVWDILALNNKGILPIQITTLPNIRAREKKIKAFLKANNISYYSEVWGIKPDKTFKILSIYE